MVFTTPKYITSLRLDNVKNFQCSRRLVSAPIDSIGAYSRRTQQLKLSFEAMCLKSAVAATLC